jgi:hypothetical protein
MEFRVTDPSNFQNTAFPESGSFYLPNRRALSLGKARTDEWPFSKVIAVREIDNAPDQTTGEDDASYDIDISAATVFHVRHESDVAGIAYPSTNAHLIRFRIHIAFAMAIEANELETFASDVEDRLSYLVPTGGI